MVLNKIIFQARKMTISKLLLVKENTIIQMMCRKKLSIRSVEDCITFLKQKHLFLEIESDQDVWEVFKTRSEELIKILDKLRTDKIEFRKKQFEDERRQKRIQKMQN